MTITSLHNFKLYDKMISYNQNHNHIFLTIIIFMCDFVVLKTNKQNHMLYLWSLFLFVVDIISNIIKDICRMVHTNTHKSLIEFFISIKPNVTKFNQMDQWIKWIKIVQLWNVCSCTKKKSRATSVNWIQLMMIIIKDNFFY